MCSPKYTQYDEKTCVEVLSNSINDDVPQFLLVQKHGYFEFLKFYFYG